MQTIYNTECERCGAVRYVSEVDLTNYLGNHDNQHSGPTSYFKIGRDRRD